MDESRIPSARSVRTFLEQLGIQDTASPRHLVDRMIFIAERFEPQDDAKRASEEAFYYLCDNYEQWKTTNSFQQAVDDLKDEACFPSEGDSTSWYQLMISMHPIE